MCTLTFVPKENTFILTSSRDEQHTRPTSTIPEWHTFEGGHQLFFSQDPTAKGTWLGHTTRGRIVSLLNGAFERHQHKPPYRMSRGLVVLEALKSVSMNVFLTQFDFRGIEPFTLIWIESFDEVQLIELRWDGVKLHFRNLPNHLSYIWSSATLYDQSVRQKRQNWFEACLDALPQIPDEKQEALLRFHYEGGKEGPSEDAICMRHEKGGTVSITSFKKNEESLNYIHHNLRNGQKTLKEDALLV